METVDMLSPGVPFGQEGGMAAPLKAASGRAAHLSFRLIELGLVDQFVKRARASGALWFFQHIPKTAGTSAVEELRTSFRPYYNVYARFTEKENVAQVEGRLDHAVEAFLGEHLQRHFRSASGHLRWHHIRLLREAIPDVRVFTLLRDPVDRVISDYRYTRTEKHPGYRAMLEQFPDLESYITNPGNRNKMWRFVAPRAMPADERGLNSVISRFAFLGTVEQFDVCWRFLTGLFGFPKMPKARRNITVTTAENEVVVTDELRQRIRELNELDQALFAKVHGIIEARREELDAFAGEQEQLFLSPA